MAGIGVIVREVICCEPCYDRAYRYLLQIRLGAGRRLAVILKNPSTADAERSDPTVGKVEAWARRHGCGTLTLVNLFALRSTHPSDLNRHSYARAVGPENDLFIRRAADCADTLIVAWGGPERDRAGAVRQANRGSVEVIGREGDRRGRDANEVRVSEAWAEVESPITNY